MNRRTARLLAPALLLFAGCATTPPPPIPGAANADHLIQPEERHFKHLWKLTAGGENAEGYWSFASDRLVYQRRDEDQGIECDRIFIWNPDGSEQISNGKGVTTCAYFLPGDRSVVFASTHGHQDACPPPPDRSKGYAWAIRPEFDLWVRDLDTGELRAITNGWGYDAEATVSPVGDRMVFTSTRSGDLELWTCDLDGSNLVQVTDTLGYDGGAFFSHDGKRLVFRTTKFDEENLAFEHERYKELLGQWLVRPHSMDIMLIDADGKNRTQLTDLGKASFAPYFFPDDSRVMFSSNFNDESARNFDLFAIDVDGTNLERITTYEGFDSFPMFSPNGRYLAFASNRGQTKAGETNLFIAEWQ